MPNNRFDEVLKSKGYCCPYGFVRMHVRNTDTVARLCMISECCQATLRNQRRAVREGRSKCLHRNTCLAALWLTERTVEVDTSVLEQEAAQQSAEAAAQIYFDYLRSTGVPEDTLEAMPFYSKPKP